MPAVVAPAFPTVPRHYDDDVVERVVTKKKARSKMGALLGNGTKRGVYALISADLQIISAASSWPTAPARGGPYAEPSRTVD